MSNRETPAFDPSGAGLDTQHPQAALDRVTAANDLVRRQHARMVLPDLEVIQALSRREASRSCPVGRHTPHPSDSCSPLLPSTPKNLTPSLPSLPPHADFRPR